jgi:dodecin
VLSEFWTVHRSLFTVGRSPFTAHRLRRAAPNPEPSPLFVVTSFMSVARVTEISSTSPNSFEEAIEQGIARATKTLRNVKSAWIKEQRVDLENGRISRYQVNLLVTFVLDDGE